VGIYWSSSLLGEGKEGNKYRCVNICSYGLHVHSLATARTVTCLQAFLH